MTTDAVRVEDRRGWFSPTQVSTALVIIGAFLLFQPIVEWVVWQQVDYAEHLSYLKPMMDAQAVGQVVSMFPHFLYHLSVYGVYRIFMPPYIGHAAMAVSLAAYIAGAVAAFWLMIRLLGKPRTYTGGVVYTAVALAVMLLMPVNLLTPTNLFVGYIGINAYHNPTIVLLKPASILLFWCGAAVFQPRAGDHNLRRSVPIWACALVTILCIVAKANFIIAFAPALALVAVYRLIRREAVDWMLLIWGIAVPTYIMLALQLVLFRSSTGFVFAPLAMINSLTRINLDAPTGWPLKLILSILFPALVYLLHIRSAARNLYLNLAWLAFIFGAAYMYLLAEGGDRLSHANFSWSAVVTLFILFIASAGFVIEGIRGKPRTWGGWRTAVCGVAFGLHVISGIHWYYIHLTSSGMGDIIATKW